ncbi:hypothetical protein CROQUDRAFT_664600 [Cronartium quercuum f. sp. fusiforme G11]|uniref:Homologous-pairing protein 2 winged helix domain-containing protein n=1 Tax=Cronartium quercuum f. sp. fusiforme G11 TaxID=708437 RepID=A0A9P6T6I7_9BASI|nr:hypothetical protein CROQUDRAFT_664600 [Cronartium quercuum f. sp. fusiforme G11]
MVGKRKDDKVEVMKGVEAENKILEYLAEQNRPYNATDLAANLRVIKKPEVTRCLTSLHESQKIEMKLFGKQQIFCCKQSGSTSTSDEELQKMKTDLLNAKEELKALNDKKTALELQLTRLKSGPTTAQIPSVKEALEIQADGLREQLRVLKEANANEELKRQAEPKSKEEIEKLDADLEKCKAMWLTRKKIGLQVINTLTENIPDEEVRACFTSQLGIEFDGPALTQIGFDMISASKNLPGNRSRQLSSRKRTLSGTVR